MRQYYKNLQVILSACRYEDKVNLTWEKEDSSNEYESGNTSLIHTQIGDEIEDPFVVEDNLDDPSPLKLMGKWMLIRREWRELIQNGELQPQIVLVLYEQAYEQEQD